MNAESSDSEVDAFVQEHEIDMVALHMSEDDFPAPQSPDPSKQINIIRKRKWGSPATAKNASFQVAPAGSSSLPEKMSRWQASGILPPGPSRLIYVCRECSFETRNSREYLYHCRDLHNEQFTIHECPFCMYATKHLQKLRRHCNLVHSELMATVSTLLSKGGDSTRNGGNKPKSELLTSNSAIKPKAPSLAPAETPKFSVPHTESKVSPKLVHKCSSCHFQTRSKFLLTQHEKTSHQKKHCFCCTYCGYVADQLLQYNRHMKRHVKPKDKCEYCDFRTLYRWNLKQHVEIHFKHGEIKCDICGYVPDSNASLTNHMTLHGTKDREETLSSESQRNLSTNSGPKQQQTTTKKDSLSLSNITDCVVVINKINSNDGQKFSNGPSNREKSLVTKLRKFKCEYCNFRSAHRSNMRKHMVRHYREGEVYCDLCDFIPDCKESMSLHLAIVHGTTADALKTAEGGGTKRVVAGRTTANLVGGKAPVLPHVTKLDKPSTSQVATKTAAGNMARHPPNPKARSQDAGVIKQLRSKLPPAFTKIKCDYCDFRSAYRWNLKKHVEGHFKNGEVACDECGFIPDSKESLQCHLLTVHNVKVESSDVSFNNMEDPFHMATFPYLVRHEEVEISGDNLKVTNYGKQKPEEPKGGCSSSLSTKESKGYKKVQGSSFNFSSGKNEQISRSPEKYSCPLCGIRFTQLPKLVSHIKRIHNNDPRGDSIAEVIQMLEPQTTRSEMLVQGNCPEADEGSSLLNAWDEAASSSGCGPESTAQVPRCYICGYRARWMSELQSHMQVHAQEKRYSCSQCNYQCNWSGNLKRHIAKHHNYLVPENYVTIEES